MQMVRFMETHNVVRFIGDEIHDLVINSEFRPAFTRLWEICLKSCQLIQLTATLPPRHEKLLMDLLGLHPSLTTLIRGETN
jgi:hypothetical protein